MTVARPALLALLLGCGSLAQAAEQLMTIKGFVYAAIPCVINRNAPINAPFNDVKIADIDGKYNTIPIAYKLDCSRSATNELRMQVRGNPAFDRTMLEIPGYDNIGIALKKDGDRWALNTWSNFDPRKQPVLQAVLVKRDDSVIKAGAFKASATLVVDYR
ncbi:fimbrial protein [Pseudomonas sichuanensis]|uniref:fimbrial protein n=1 Tax=Pseudomonas sichuanensis TaxID=2213015 RepID=UPI00244C5636|nr:fimbrial protein [Pseudomonas sichuanensis]MDH0731317.1 fimbrial protein [Pseudomonas sichuanensis]MDH1583508.1 fimbrial protein [Pseudomonas sichuanensis]MDH1592754.1 fimbrial protein [Pseudomonas sichuanensis]MDH1598649.1 fimbrial protein [Pseudomonas sichuanensis]